LIETADSGVATERTLINPGAAIVLKGITKWPLPYPTWQNKDLYSARFAKVGGVS
jgi:hypothetical protein